MKKLSVFFKTIFFLLCFEILLGKNKTTPVPLGENPDTIHLEELKDVELGTAEIRVKNGIMTYTGDIGIKSWELFERKLNEYKGKKTHTLIINSLGGDTVIGRKIGSWVWNNKIDVEIDTICFSSCANYIFTAAKKKLFITTLLWGGMVQKSKT